MQLYGVVYASPLVSEVLDLSFEVVDPACVHISYTYFLAFWLFMAHKTLGQFAGFT
jgi:hypothetical protein